MHGTAAALWCMLSAALVSVLVKLFQTQILFSVAIQAKDKYHL